MAKFVLSAFADEAGSLLDEQILALKENEIDYIEPRNIGGKGILTLSEEELSAVKAKLDENKIKVNSLGSPIGKYPIEKPLEEHLPDFERALKACEILGTENMRMFSFFIPAGEPAANYTDEVTLRLREMVKLAKLRNIRLNHENESKIFGQNPEEVNVILDSVPEIYAIFDGANYRMNDCNVMAGIEATLKRLGYLHIKDAIYKTQTIVPAGEGEARLGEILDLVDASTDKVVYLTIEPHLHIFDAYKDIDEHELLGKYKFNTKREAFDFATSALKKLLTQRGYRKDESNVWKK